VVCFGSRPKGNEILITMKATRAEEIKIPQGPSPRPQDLP